MHCFNGWAAGRCNKALCSLKAAAAAAAAAAGKHAGLSAGRVHLHYLLPIKSSLASHKSSVKSMIADDFSPVCSWAVATADCGGGVEFAARAHPIHGQLLFVFSQPHGTSQFLPPMSCEPAETVYQLLTPVVVSL